MISIRKLYESKTPREGTCGPTIVAYLTGKTVKEIIDNWTIPYRGYCSLKELQKNIERYHFKTDRIKSEEKRQFIMPENESMAVARIRWSGKISKWEIEEKNTHFVLLDQTQGELQLFDNEVGLFKLNDETAKKYMKNGKITSYLVIYV